MRMNAAARQLGAALGRKLYTHGIAMNRLSFEAFPIVACILIRPLINISIGLDS